MIVSACAGEPRTWDTSSPAPFVSDDAADSSSPACLLQCSPDFRSVVRSCDDVVVETCPPELGCADARCIEPCAAAAVAKSSLGCEFYLQPPPVSQAYANSCYAAYIVNSWNTPVDVVLEHDGRPLDLSGAVYRFVPGTANIERSEGPIPPGDAVVVFLASAPPASTSEVHVDCPAGTRPALDFWPLPKGTGRASSLHLTSNVPVSLSTVYPFGGAASHYPSATLLLPVATWGKQHIVVEPWQKILGYSESPGVQIVASEENTDVTVVPNVDIQDGVAIVGGKRGAALKYHLSRGEVLQISQAEELSGSLVDANKPISLFGGHDCMFIPSDVRACDSAQQQIPAFEQWGSEYVAVRYRGRSGDNEASPYRIVAAVDGTVLTYDPAPPTGAPSQMNAGKVVTFWTDSPFVVRSQDAEHPFYLAAYMSGANTIPNNALGDPEFVNVVPAGQYMSAYMFYADPTYTETSLVLIRAKSTKGFEDVWLDCAGGPVEGWTAVDSAGRFEYRRVDLARAGGHGETFPGGTCANGLQRMRSKGPFTATLWGWSDWASYAYPGGMAQRKLVSRPLEVH
ncbi:hypothetical protein AKJ09_01774 [Labilithrix luteola]|uniref:IgGFc-binding protein N-terminal domain-containing protein n=2 Tax=Labilithrix luteola TaxID=1391654 RepID=A0A0K1PNJ2_9BACT|nr:hypothetical protein AKJ09_01774 [Labilithrix luteola]